MKKHIRKSKTELMPGTLIKCESGRYIAFYEHRTDIIANGENELDTRKNLREMYSIIKKHEIEDTENERHELALPEKTETKRFVERLKIY